MVGAMHVAADSELDGAQMSELSSEIRVVAFAAQDAPVQLRPRRDDRLGAGDTVYLVGPYRKLLSTLRRGLPPRRPTTGDGRTRDDHDAQPDSPEQAVGDDVGRQARAG
jgi:hypothetical protein